MVVVLSEQAGIPAAQDSGTGRRAGTLVTLGAALVVLLLALGSVLWPSGRQGRIQGAILVLDPAAGPQRQEKLYRPLTGFLEAMAGEPLRLVVARDVADFQLALETGVDFVMCPDGVALGLDPGGFEPLVTGRRPAPRNLRPRSVLLFRKTAGLVDQPWKTLPQRTVLGDSLSLAGGGGLRGGGASRPACAFGPDPYDHAPVIHAARLGAFDYARVRQWDVDNFFAAGLLLSSEWGVEPLSVPVPDLVVLASRNLPTTLRLKAREGLSGLGRSGDKGTEGKVVAGLSLIHLAGFNILLEPDFERIRGIFAPDWQAPTN